MKRSLNSGVWPVVHNERDALIHDLEQLDRAQWSTATLCTDWDVHDVVAHLIDTAKTTRLSFIGRLVAAGFDFDRDNAVGITREKSADPLLTLAGFRAVRSRTSTPPAALATRLVEAFVHGEDIRRALGISRTYPPDHVASALRYQIATSTKIGGGRELAAGWRLEATDAAFEHGDGPEVHAPAITLLLALSGRPVREDELAGPGAPAFLAAVVDGRQ